MKYDHIIKAAYFACIAVGVDPSTRNVTRATAKVRSIAGEEKPVWGEHVRVWLQQNDTRTIQARRTSDTVATRADEENDTEAIQRRHPRGRVVKELVLEAIESNTAYLPLAASQPALIDKVLPPAARPKTQRSEIDLACDKIRQVAWPLVRTFTGYVGERKDWFDRNKRGALRLVKAQKKPEDVERLLRVAYENPAAKEWYGQIQKLETLADKWQKLTDIEAAGERGGNAPVMPDVYENAGRSFDPRIWEKFDSSEFEARFAAANG